MMQDFTNNRTPETLDEVWLLEHTPVYTYGAHTKPKIPKVSIPITTTDRGGNITYHGPGQIIIYPLLDTNRLNYNIHDLIERLELLTLKLMQQNQLEGHLFPGRRGVYYDNKKIASIGLKFKRYCSYHGLAINVNLDLEPFQFIKPCGYDQEVTSLKQAGINIEIADIKQQIIPLITKYLAVKPKELG